MRVTQTMMNYDMRRNIQKRLEDCNKYQEQISSGSKLGSLSDDPVALGKTMTIQTALNKQTQYLKNIDNNKAWLEQSETAISGISDIVSNVKELAIQAGDAAVGDDELGILGEEVGELIDQIVIYANTLLGQGYVFGGYQMDKPAIVDNEVEIPDNLFPLDDSNIDTSQEQTFMWQFNDPNEGDSQSAYKIEYMDADGNITATDWQDGSDNQYTFAADTFAQGNYQWRVTTRDQAGEEATSDWVSFNAGTTQDDLTQPEYTQTAVNENAILIGDKWCYANNDSVTREVAPGVTMRVNVSGDNIFDTLQTLTDLKEALDSGDSSAATDLLDQIDDNFNSLVQQGSVIGVKINRLDDLKNMMESQQVELETILSDVSGVDIESASVQLAEAELSYQASLAVATKLMQTSILDYI